MKRIFISVLSLLFAFSNNLYAKSRYKDNKTDKESNLILQISNADNPKWCLQHASHRSHSSHYSCVSDRDSVISALPIMINDIVRSYLKNNFGSKIQFDDLFRINSSIVVLKSFDNKVFKVSKKVLRIKVSSYKYQIFIPIDAKDETVYIHEYKDEKAIHYTLKKEKWMCDLIEQVK